jgi:hypothetical protein
VTERAGGRNVTTNALLELLERVKASFRRVKASFRPPRPEQHVQ